MIWGCTLARGGAAFNGAVTQSNAPLLLATNTTTFAGVISGAGSLTLSGTPVTAGANTLANTGTLVLTAADTYSGATTVNGGALTLNGAGGGSPARTADGSEAGEPTEIGPAERPSLLGKAADLLLANGVSVDEFAAIAGLPLDLLLEVVESGRDRPRLEVTLES